jgi:thioredoxin 1
MAVGRRVPRPVDPVTLAHTILYEIPKTIITAGGVLESMSSTESVPAEPIQLSSPDEFDDLVADHDVVLVDFYADWCGPCRMMEPAVESVAAETDAAVVKVDVDVHQSLAAEYGVQGIPTLLVFAGGELADRMVGAQNEDALTDAITEHTA